MAPGKPHHLDALQTVLVSLRTGSHRRQQNDDLLLPPVSSGSCSLNKNCISCHLHSSSVLIYRLHFDLETLNHWLHTDCCFRPPSAPRGPLQFKALTDRPKYSVADRCFFAVCTELCPYCNILFSYALRAQLNQVKYLEINNSESNTNCRRRTEG